MISFACFAPHAPILLPSVGSEKDRLEVKKTTKNLEELGQKMNKVDPDAIVISSPHPDWGFDVPLYFLARRLGLRSNFGGGGSIGEGGSAGSFRGDIRTYLIGSEPPKFYFEQGRKTFRELEADKKYALIASGDLSHCLKEDGPYGFHPQGPKFDESLIKFLKKRDIENFLKLDELFPQAGECGLRSFCFVLGIMDEAKIDWRPEILSYEGPFGVGYLVAEFKSKTF